MYDVHGKSVSGEDKGRMQQAVDDWEKAAEDAAGMNEKYDDKEFDAEVKDIIKNNFNGINAGKAHESENRQEQSADNKKEELPLTAQPNVRKDSGIIKDDGNFAKGDGDGFSVQNDRQSDENLIDSQIDGIDDDNDDYDDDDADDNDGDGNDEPHDYESEEQAQEILEEQTSFQLSLAARFGACFICAAVLVWIAVAPQFGIELPIFMSPVSHPSNYILANLILLLVAGLLGFSVAFKGIAGLFTFKPCADSVTSLSFYAALIGGAYALYSCTVSKAAPASLPLTAAFSSCAAAGIALNLLGGNFSLARVKNNLEFLSSPANIKGGFYAGVPVAPVNAQDLMHTFQGTPSVVTTEKVNFLSNFLEQSYGETPSDRAAMYLSPIALVCAVIAAACEIWIKKDIPGAVTVFTAICCIASPLLLEFGVAVPFYRACKRLVKHQALVTGCSTVLQLGGTDALVADSSLAFSGQTTRIYNVRTYSGHKIEEAVIYASSVAYAGKSPLTEAFLNMFADVDSGKNLLMHVEKIVYEDDKGLSAVIDGKSVLLGNRALLRHHIVESPSRDFELRYAIGGKDVTYLAIDGQFCAMFVIGYGFSDNTASAIHRLRHSGLCMLIEASDPNITPQFLEEKFNLSARNVTMLGAREMQILEAGKSDSKHKAGLAFKDIRGYVAALIACVKLKGSLLANTMLQFVLAIAGILLVDYAAFFAGGASAITPAFVIAYQLLCAVPVLLISLFRRI